MPKHSKQHKRKPDYQYPLYKIYYSVGMITVKAIHFQTEKQFNNWRNTSYAIAKQFYEITIEKQNNKTYYEYNKIYLDK